MKVRIQELKARNVFIREFGHVIASTARRRENKALRTSARGNKNELNLQIHQKKNFCLRPITLSNVFSHGALPKMANI